LDPLPEYAWCRKYESGSTLPKAVRGLRKELAKTPEGSKTPRRKDKASDSHLQIYESPATARETGEFKVTVNGRSVFVEQLAVEKDDLDNKFSGCEALSYHCARFAFDGQVKIRVTANTEGDGFRLRPASAGIQTKVDGSTVEFTMTEPRNLMLDSGLAWLYIFADRLKNDAPQLDTLKEVDSRGDMDKKVFLDKQDRKVVNVMNYGPDPSGEKLSTHEIQKAIIETAVGPYPGGTLYFPSGVYKTGSLRLYSGVTLYLADGALIQGSKNPADYPLPFGVEHGAPNRDYGYDYALIKIHHCENVVIRGRGTIDAGGAANGRLKIIHVENSRNVTVEDVVVRNTIGWMFPILHSENVVVKNARVISPITSNTDGINPDSSIDITLDGNFIVSGDDSVAVKATNFGMRLRDEIKNIRVVNNVLLTMKSSLKIGTETQSRRIHDIVFENNDILMADRAFTLYLRDGALIENVTFRNNRVEIPGGLSSDKNRTIDIDISKRDDDIWRNPRFNEAQDNPGNIRNVLFENITIGTKESRYLDSSRISGHNRDNAVSNIVFRNFRVNGQKILDPSVSIPVGNSGKTKTFMKIDEDAARDIVFE
jgi:hypothetical protein